MISKLNVGERPSSLSLNGRAARVPWITENSCSVASGVFAIVDGGVRDYTDFNEDNDPYGEHDFGSLKVAGEKIFWKIDYYDESLSKWCDPLDPDCQRVLTIMLAEEY